MTTHALAARYLDLDLHIARRASEQLGLITHEQLRGLGLSPSGIAKRVQRGRLHRVQPRTYAVGHAALPFEALILAAQLSIGPGTFASGRCAAYTWGCYKRGRPFVEVTTTRRHRGLEDVVVRFTRSVTAAEITRRGPILIATPARTIVDLAEHRTPHQVAHAIHEARRLRLLRLQDLDVAARRHLHRHGHGRLVRALELHRSGSAGTRSTAEDDFLDMVLAGPIPEPHVNVHVTAGRRKFEVDFLWPDRKLCVEVDGPEHDLPERQRLDEERDARLHAAGYEVIRIPVAFLMGGYDVVRSRFPS